MKFDILTEVNIMKQAYIDLIRYSLKAGMVISVFDGEEWSTIKSSKFKEIIDDIKGVEEAQIRIRDKDNTSIGWALISPYGNAPDESVIDYSDNDFMDGWWNQFNN